ncbi:PTO1314 family radical SAM protein [Sulfurisphaera javensis]|uniref:PTO1314 family radical SAM protein n=1 Tax=Sulfurisphaera javensis TaxID=2049879 RepID=A0AAT9GPX4_9CREN
MGKVKSMTIGNFLRLVKGRGIKKMPLIAGHKLLYSCNLRCRMCPFWRRKDERLLSLEEEIKMMNALQTAGVLFMGFEGGEPLLRKDLPEILEESSKRFYTSLVTNGWLLKDKVREIRDYVDYLFVSIDGIGETHDKIRGINGAFERAIEGIKESVKQGIQTGISFTLTEENTNEIINVINLAEKLGVRVNVQVAYDYSTAEKLSPSGEKLKKALETLIELKERGKPIIESEDYFKAILSSWFYNIPWICKPWITINIDPQGKIILPCYVIGEYRGDKKVWEVDIVKLWNEYDWDKYSLCNKCALSCYLEPSLFTWRNPRLVKERIVQPMIEVISSNFKKKLTNKKII